VRQRRGAKKEKRKAAVADVCRVPLPFAVLALAVAPAWPSARFFVFSPLFFFVLPRLDSFFFSPLASFASSPFLLPAASAS
jgi:hypothetical protein